jgi:hypothetical protein
VFSPEALPPFSYIKVQNGLFSGEIQGIQHWGKEAPLSSAKTHYFVRSRQLSYFLTKAIRLNVNIKVREDVNICPLEM